MSFEFTSGHYRAFVRTSYTDQYGVAQIIDGEKVEFDCDVKNYFTFHSNPNIKIDPETLEVPGATETGTGTYKGLTYKAYNNGLYVITGDQTEAIPNPTSEEDHTKDAPWYENADYIYTKCNITGGYVFKNKKVKELKTGYLGFVSGNTTAPASLFHGNYEYLDIIGLDISNTTTLRSLFNAVETEEIDGLEELGVNLAPSNVTDIFCMLHGLHRTGPDRIIFISAGTTNITSMSYAFGITGENTELSLHVTKGMPFMCSTNIGINDHPLKMLTLSCDEFSTTYSINPLAQCLAKNIRIVGFPDTSTNTYFSSMCYKCKYLETLQIWSRTGFSTASMDVAIGMFQDCPNLKRITDENGSNYELNVSALTNAKDMFSGCENLEELPFARDNDGIDFPSLRSCDGMFYKCFEQTENVWPYLEMKLGRNMLITFDNFCEESGFKGVVLRLNAERLSSFPSLFSAFKNSQVELVTIEVNSLQAGTGVVTDRKYFESACEGCTKLIYFQYLGATNLAVYVMGTLSKMFYGCSNLTDVDMAYLLLHGDVDATDMFAGCTKLDEFVTPAGHDFSIDLPKTMYAGGTAYTVAQLKNTKYDATP